LICLLVSGIEKKPDVNSKKNSPKRVFCRKYDGYEDFCRGLSHSLLWWSWMWQLSVTWESLHFYDQAL